jgi:hypothetical protein
MRLPTGAAAKANEKIVRLRRDLVGLAEVFLMHVDGHTCDSKENLAKYVEAQEKATAIIDAYGSKGVTE